MEIKAIWNNEYKDDCIPNFSNNRALPRHRWYEFKEGYGASLVKRAIHETREACNKETLNVLDPFSGSGTTPLTALQNDCNAIGFEVNPFMSFVGETKCKPTKGNQSFTTELESILNQKPIEMESPLEKVSTFCESITNKDKWLFNRSVLRGFEALKYHIDSTEAKPFFMLALFSSVMACCNAKKDGKCLRYKKDWKSYSYSSSSLRLAFKKKCQQIYQDIVDDTLTNGTRNFYQGDSRKTFSNLDDNSVELIVFSPPYLNSFDYSDIYRPELFLGGFVDDNESLREIRKETLRSHVQYRWMTNDKSSSTWACSIASDLEQRKDDLWDSTIPQMVNAYFCDMEAILNNSYRVAAKDAQIWFVVSTSAYCGIEVPVDLILADIAVKQGWKLCNVNALRDLRTSSQCVNDQKKKIRLRESLVICQK